MRNADFGKKLSRSPQIFVFTSLTAVYNPISSRTRKKASTITNRARGTVQHTTLMSKIVTGSTTYLLSLKNKNPPRQSRTRGPVVPPGFFVPGLRTPETNSQRDNGRTRPALCRRATRKWISGRRPVGLHRRQLAGWSGAAVLGFVIVVMGRVAPFGFDCSGRGIITAGVTAVNSRTRPFPGSIPRPGPRVAAPCASGRRRSGARIPHPAPCASGTTPRFR